MSEASSPSRSTDSHPIHRMIFSSSRIFRSEWLTAGNKDVAPVALPSGLNRSISSKIERAARGLEASHVVVEALGHGTHGDNSAVPAFAGPLLEHCSSIDGDFLVAAPNLDGVVLITPDGFALAAGTASFLAPFAPRGVDSARAEFLQFTKKMNDRYPQTDDISRYYAPRHRVFKSGEDLEGDSYVGRQFRLMELLDSGSITPGDFARSWLSARRESLAAGERVRGGVSEILDDVFYSVEEYPIDSDLHEQGDLTDEEFISQVRAAVQRMRSL